MLISGRCIFELLLSPALYPKGTDMKVVSSHLTLSKWLDKCIHIMSNHFFTGSGEPNYKKKHFLSSSSIQPHCFDFICSGFQIFTWLTSNTVDVNGILFVVRNFEKFNFNSNLPFQKQCPCYSEYSAEGTPCVSVIY